jgi:hypothetical protein
MELVTMTATRSACPGWLWIVPEVPCYSPVTSLFVPCSECSKSGDAMPAESPGGASLLAIAVIGKPGGGGKRAISPVFFPVTREFGADISPVNGTYQTPSIMSESEI